MMYQLENEETILKVNSLGAEVTSFVKKADGVEYIWQGDEKYWTGHAPVMFPICGRLFKGKYTYDGKKYEMGCHGFARQSEFVCEAQSETSLTLRLGSSETTKASYPFDFELRITYTLCGAGYRMEFAVTNTDQVVLPFTLGGHPAFNVPLEAGENFDDYYVTFDRETPVQQILSGPEKLVEEKPLPLTLEEGVRLPLRHGLFDNDALFLFDTCGEVTLRSQKSTRAVHLSYRDFRYLGLWHFPESDAPYLCLEPWCGIASYEGREDDLDTKRDMFRLLPGRVCRVGFTVTIQ